MRRVLLAVLAVVMLSVVLGRTNDAGEARRIEQVRMRLNDGVLRAVVMGDSVARGAGDEQGLGIAGSLDRQLRILGVRAETVVNLGINGARTFHVRQLLACSAARLAVRKADVVVLSIGGNDLYGDSHTRVVSRFLPLYQQYRTLRNVERIVSTLQRENLASRIYLLGLYNPYPRTSLRGWLDRQVNLWDARLITRFASARNVTVIRICDLLDRDDRISAIDRFHPGAQGYEAIAARIASSI